jgi:hypothetical protein
MEDEKVVDLIQVAENLTKNFQNFDASTLMGWFPKHDSQGRPINADPNEQWTVFTFENVLAKVVRTEWMVGLYLSEKMMTQDQAMIKSLENWNKVAEIDLTPTYLAS